MPSGPSLQKLSQATLGSPFERQLAVPRTAKSQNASPLICITTGRTGTELTMDQNTGNDSVLATY